MTALPDLDLMESFLGVVRHGSVSAAAPALGLTQPALSKRIARLEAALGRRLLDRGTRPARLTPAGRQLAAEAPALLARAREMLDRLERAEARPGGRLRFGMSDTLGALLGAEAVGLMGGMARSLEVRTVISPGLEAALLAGELDLCIDCPPFPEGLAGAGRPLFADPFVAVVPRALGGRPLGEIVAEVPHVGYGQRSKFGRRVTELAGALGARGPARFNFDSTQSLLRFVEAGYGWAITSALCLVQVPQALRGMALLPCPAPDASAPERRFFLLDGPDGEPERAARVQAILRGVFARLLAGPWARAAPAAAGMLAAANPEAPAWAAGIAEAGASG